MADNTQDITKLQLDTSTNLTDKITVIKQSNELNNISLNALLNNTSVINKITENLIDNIKILFLGDKYFNLDNTYKNYDIIEIIIEIANIKYKKIYLLCNGQSVKSDYAINKLLNITKTPDLNKGGVFNHVGNNSSIEEQEKNLGSWQENAMQTFGFSTLTYAVQDTDTPLLHNLQNGEINYNNTSTSSIVPNPAGLTNFVIPIKFTQQALTSYRPSIYFDSTTLKLRYTKDKKTKMDNYLGQWYILADIVKA